MIIRHDLKLVFIHVPKCAGKQLRWIFKQGAEAHAIEELWNYEHNTILNRYVDLAHLPLSDLRTYPQFKYLNRYKVVACVRNPYMRLPSAVNEYYRQKSKYHETLVKEGKLTMELRQAYYRKMPRKHCELDPRFIHSLPIHRFTHYGFKAKVDHLLRCERLDEDIQELSRKLDWPAGLQNAIDAKVSYLVGKKEEFMLTEKEKSIAERIYKVDFETFGYMNMKIGEKKTTKKSGKAGSVKQIHNLDEVSWHWGPTAERSIQKRKPTRTTC